MARDPHYAIDNNDATISPNIITSILTVLNEFDHPCVLVGQAAHRWMGCAGCVDNAIDLLVRDDQLDLITAAFIKSGLWGLFNTRSARVRNNNTTSLPSKVDDEQHRQPYRGPEDPQQPEHDQQDQPYGGDKDPQQPEDDKQHQFSQGDQDPQQLDDDVRLEGDLFLKYCCDADQALRLTMETTQKWPFNYIRLWSEQTFHIKVDGPVLVPIPALYHGKPLLAENDFHPTLNRADGWHFGPKQLSDLDDGAMTVGEAGNSNLFILNIPSYLDALVYHTTRYAHTKPSLAFMSRWQIRNLTRYLYLELPDLRNRILFEVEGSTERFLENYFNNYKRKPFYVLSEEGELVLVERHCADSYSGSLPRQAGTPRSLVQ